MHPGDPCRSTLWGPPILDTCPKFAKCRCSREMGPPDLCQRRSNWRTRVSNCSSIGSHVSEYRRRVQNLITRQSSKVLLFSGRICQPRWKHSVLEDAFSRWQCFGRPLNEARRAEICLIVTRVVVGEATCSVSENYWCSGCRFGYRDVIYLYCRVT